MGSSLKKSSLDHKTYFDYLKNSIFSPYYSLGLAVDVSQVIIR